MPNSNPAIVDRCRQQTPHRENREGILFEGHRVRQGMAMRAVPSIRGLVEYILVSDKVKKHCLEQTKAVNSKCLYYYA
jgi:hypothetical protein